MNAPRTWPNSSLSNSVSTTAEQLTVTNGRVAPRSGLVERAGRELLARAGLAGEQHRLRVRREPLNEAEHLLHRGAAADHAAEFELARDSASSATSCARRVSSARTSASTLPRRTKSNGLVRYSRAPSLMASTALSTPRGRS